MTLGEMRAALARVQDECDKTATEILQGDGADREGVAEVLTQIGAHCVSAQRLVDVLAQAASQPAHHKPS